MKTVLFDLDGTLTDPRQGIVRSIQYALEKAGHAVPAEEDLLWCIGPPLQESFPGLVPGLSKEGCSQLIGYYRERFGVEGMYENSVYPGILGLLDRLSRKNRLFVATSKPRFYAEKIADHFQFARFFTQIFGSELSGERSNKGELIRFILDQKKPRPEDCVMIGDRLHDIRGAKAANIASIGVTWGYGSFQELKEAGADHICQSVDELTEIIGTSPSRS